MLAPSAIKTNNKANNGLPVAGNNVTSLGTSVLFTGSSGSSGTESSITLMNPVPLEPS